MIEYEFKSDNVEEISEYLPKIFWSNDNHLLVTGDIFLKGQPKDDVFFKVYRINENNEINGVCRISLNNPHYVTGYDENIILNNNELFDIVKGLTEDNYIGWKMLLEQTNYYLEAIDSKIQYNMNYPIPDYTQLKQ